jgi:hypothetical protein
MVKIRSVAPLCVWNREATQQATDGLPLRHVFIHQCRESITVSTLKQTHEFMDDDVLKTLTRLFGEFSIQANRPCRLVACPPHGLHLPDEDSLGIYIEDRCPLFDEGEQCGSKDPLA